MEERSCSRDSLSLRELGRGRPREVDRSQEQVVSWEELSLSKEKPNLGIPIFEAIGAATDSRHDDPATDAEPDWKQGRQVLQGT